LRVRIEKFDTPPHVKIIDVATGEEVPRVLEVSISMRPEGERCKITLEAESFEICGEFNNSTTKEVN